MNLETMTRAQMAAAILLAVGPSRAARILEHLEEELVEQATVTIATLGDIPMDVMDAIFDRFQTEAHVQQQLISGSEQSARELLRRIHPDRADEIIDRILATTHAAPFHFLRVHDPGEVLQHLREEHPQTIALVFAHLPSRLGSQLLSGLDPDIQIDVATRLATLGRIDPQIVEQVEHTLRSRLGEVRRRTDRRDGIKELADLLNQADRHTERAILTELEVTHPDLAEQVRALMFLFEDVITLDDRSLQELLRHVDMRQLAIALKGTNRDVREIIEANLSTRAQLALNEEIDLLGAVRLSEVEQSQAEIVRLVHELEEEGMIVIGRGEEQYVA